jgi:hypothetical protein
MAMLEVSADRLTHLHLSAHDVATYITEHGWHKVPHSNQRLLVFQGPLDDCGNPIHLILPSQNDFGDSYLRLAEAVELLANIEERPSEAVLADIQNAVATRASVDELSNLKKTDQFYSDQEVLSLSKNLSDIISPLLAEKHEKYTRLFFKRRVARAGLLAGLITLQTLLLYLYLRSGSS